MGITGSKLHFAGSTAASTSLTADSVRESFDYAPLTMRSRLRSSSMRADFPVAFFAAIA